MLIYNQTDEIINFSIDNICENLVIQNGEQIEVNCFDTVKLKVCHQYPSDYYLEKFTKAPRCILRVNTVFTIENITGNTKVNILKNDVILDDIFSYDYVCCSIVQGNIANEEYEILDIHKIIEKHKKQLAKASKHDFLIFSLFTFDFGLGVFLWKCCGYKVAILVMLFLLILLLLINKIINFVSFYFKKNTEQYLNYFDNEYIKMVRKNTRGQRDG